MTLIKTMTASVAALSLLGVSTAAAAQTAPAASKLSVAGQARTGAKMTKANGLRSEWIIGLLVAAAVVVGIILIADDDDPTSA